MIVSSTVLFRDPFTFFRALERIHEIQLTHTCFVSLSLLSPQAKAELARREKEIAEAQLELEQLRVRAHICLGKNSSSLP